MRLVPWLGGLAWVAYAGLALAAEPATSAAGAAAPEYPEYGGLNSRLLIWGAMQLHLLFAAFVLAVPMFVLIIEIISISKAKGDPEEAKKYDHLAHEFCRLLTTAFSITSILGAVATFLFIALYPKFASYLTNVFGPTMYLYALIFFGESFTLYFYYYGWGKFKSRWTHIGLGVALNVFGVSLMLIANAWTTFTMAPAGLNEAGEVGNRSQAFWNFLLHPINIHRLIANLCMGGSVAAAYAAFKWLTTKDPAKRAHYDWMGYVGNFIAILFLLPLPFAGYYLGYEIYQFNQQLGVYMMGGVLSWLFVMQAVLIGGLFFAANYYLWIGMDRIEGAERFRPWVKFLLFMVTACILVWATPKSLILTSAEIDAMGGNNHPVLSPFGVMSAKNTAVNLLIMTTFLSFLLYRRGNRLPTVSWAKLGTALQTMIFAAAAAVVIFIGVGGYIPELWLESDKRIGMSPWQVISVLICIFLVMGIDLAMMRGAKVIGKVRWGETPRRAQYTLLFLAVSFTWLMALMGFVRSSLRQGWHVFGVLQDTSPQAFTPTIGDATVIVTGVVMVFFLLVGMVVAIANLGTKEVVDHAKLPPVPASTKIFRLATLVGLVVVGSVIINLFASREVASKPNQKLLEARAQARAELASYAATDLEAGLFKAPIDYALERVAADGSLLEPPIQVKVDLDDMSPIERGQHLFETVQGCTACHATNSTVKQAPALNGRFGAATKLEGGKTASFDDAYVRASLMDPKQSLAEGFAKGAEMPSFQGRMSEQELQDLLTYLKSL
jgi:cytochrome bd-type quinol oxidase subunit 1/mono/diheme cytochrome c family protein